jgi:surface polysaccharide O-acyltransferase-like enzyme
MKLMAGTAQTILTVSVPTLAVLIGILVNNARLSDRMQFPRRLCPAF